MQTTECPNCQENLKQLEQIKAELDNLYETNGDYETKLGKLTNEFREKEKKIKQLEESGAGRVETKEENVTNEEIEAYKITIKRYNSSTQKYLGLLSKVSGKSAGVLEDMEEEELQTLTDQLRNAVSKYKSVEEERDSFRKKNTALEEELKKLSDQLFTKSHVEDSVKLLKAENEQLKTSLSRKEAELADKLSDYAKLRTQFANSTESYKKAIKEKKDLENDNSKLDLERLALIRDLESVNNLLNDKRQELESFQDNLSALRIQSSELHYENTSLHSTIAQLTKTVQEYQQKFEKMTKEKSKNDDLNALLNQTYQFAFKDGSNTSYEEKILKIQILTKEYTQLKTENKNLSLENQHLQTKIDSLTTANKSKASEIDSLVKLIEELKNQISHSESEKAQEKFKEKTVNIMQSAVSKIRANKASGEQGILKQENEHLQLRVKQLTQENEKLLQDLENLQRERKTLLVDKDALSSEMQKLSQAHAFLSNIGKLIMKPVGGTESLDQSALFIRIESEVRRLQATETEHRELKETVEKTNLQVRELEQKLDTLQKNNMKQKYENEDLVTSNNEVKKKLEQLGGDLRFKDSEIDRLKSESSQFKRQSEELKVEKKQLTLELNNQQGEVAKLDQIVKDLSDKLTKQTEASNKRVNDLRMTLKLKSVAIKIVNDDKRVLKNEMDESTVKVKQLRATLAKIIGISEEEFSSLLDSQQLNEKIDAAQNKVSNFNALQSEKNILTDKVKNLEQEIKTLRQENATTVVQLSTANAKIEKLTIGNEAEAHDQQSQEKSLEDGKNLMSDRIKELEEEKSKKDKRIQELGGYNRNLVQVVSRALRIEENEVIVGQREHSELLQKSDVLQEKIANLKQFEKETQELRRKLDETASLKEKLQIDCKVLEKGFQDAQKASAELETVKNKLEITLQARDNEIERLINESSKAQSQYSTLREDNDRLETSQKTLEIERENLALAKEKVEAELHNANKEKITLEKNSDQLKERIATLETSIAAKDGEKENLANQINELKIQLENEKTETRKTREEKDLLQSMVNLIDHTYKLISSEESALSKEDKINEIQKALSDSKSLQEVNEFLKKENSDLIASVESLNKNLFIKTAELSELSMQVNETKKQLEDERATRKKITEEKEKLNQIVGLVDQIHELIGMAPPELTEEQKVSEIQKVVQEHKALQKDNTALKEDNAKLLSEVEAMISDLQSKSSESSGLASQLDEMNKKLHELKESHSDPQKENVKQKTGLLMKDAQGNIAAEKSTNEANTLSEELNALKRENSELSRDKQELEKALEEEVENNVKLQKQQKTFQEERERLLVIKTSVENLLSEISGQKSQDENEYGIKRKLEIEVKKLIDESKDRLELQKTLEKLNVQKAEVDSRLKKLNEVANSNEAEMQKTIDRLNIEKTEFDSELKKLKEEAKSKEVEVQKLREAVEKTKEYEKQIIQLNEQLKLAQSENARLNSEKLEQSKTQQKAEETQVERLKSNEQSVSAHDANQFKILKDNFENLLKDKRAIENERNELRLAHELLKKESEELKESNQEKTVEIEHLKETLVIHKTREESLEIESEKLNARIVHLKNKEAELLALVAEYKTIQKAISELFGAVSARPADNSGSSTLQQVAEIRAWAEKVLRAGESNSTPDENLTLIKQYQTLLLILIQDASAIKDFSALEKQFKYFKSLVLENKKLEDNILELTNHTKTLEERNAQLTETMQGMAHELESVPKDVIRIQKTLTEKELLIKQYEKDIESLKIDVRNLKQQTKIIRDYEEHVAKHEDKRDQELLKDLAFRAANVGLFSDQIASSDASIRAEHELAEARKKLNEYEELLKAKEDERLADKNQIKKLEAGIQQLKTSISEYKQKLKDQEMPQQLGSKDNLDDNLPKSPSNIQFNEQTVKKEVFKKDQIIANLKGQLNYLGAIVSMIVGIKQAIYSPQADTEGLEWKIQKLKYLIDDFENTQAKLDEKTIQTLLTQSNNSKDAEEIASLKESLNNVQKLIDQIKKTVFEENALKNPVAPLKKVRVLFGEEVIEEAEEERVVEEEEELVGFNAGKIDAEPQKGEGNQPANNENKSSNIEQTTEVFEGIRTKETAKKAELEENELSRAPADTHKADSDAMILKLTEHITYLEDQLASYQGRFQRTSTPDYAVLLQELQELRKINSDIYAEVLRKENTDISITQSQSVARITSILARADLSHRDFEFVQNYIRSLEKENNDLQMQVRKLQQHKEPTAETLLNILKSSNVYRVDLLVNILKKIDMVQRDATKLQREGASQIDKETLDTFLQLILNAVKYIETNIKILSFKEDQTTSQLLSLTKTAGSYGAHSVDHSVKYKLDEGLLAESHHQQLVEEKIEYSERTNYLQQKFETNIIEDRYLTSPARRGIPAKVSPQRSYINSGPKRKSETNFPEENRRMSQLTTPQYQIDAAREKQTSTIYERFTQENSNPEGKIPRRPTGVRQRPKLDDNFESNATKPEIRGSLILTSPYSHRERASPSTFQTSQPVLTPNSSQAKQESELLMPKTSTNRERIEKTNYPIQPQSTRARMQGKSSFWPSIDEGKTTLNRDNRLRRVSNYEQISSIDRPDDLLNSQSHSRNIHETNDNSTLEKLKSRHERYTSSRIDSYSQQNSSQIGEEKYNTWNPKSSIS